MYDNSIKSSSCGGDKWHAKSRALLLSTTAFMVGSLLASSDAVADGSWNYDTVLGGNVSKVIDDVTHTTDIIVDGGNGFVEGNADIKAGHSVNVEGMNGARTFAYRDNRDNITSTLSGNLNSNIQVVIIDKDGLFFTSLSKIDVQGLIVTSADVAVADIMDGGTLVLDNVGDGGAVVIDGSITVSEAGLAAFVSPFISNRGLIKAKLGNVVMAAGDAVTLDMYGDGLVEVAVDGELADALIANVGKIKAAGGFVQITAKAAKGTLDNLINNEGLITVSSAEVQGGKIILSGGNSGTIDNDGVLKASEGGSIDISGERFEQGSATPSFVLAALEGGDAPIPPRKPAIRGGDITIETDGSVEIYEGRVNARGGDINIDNGGVFYSANANTLKTSGNGTITLNQSMGLVLPALKLSSIQNAVDAVDNSGNGRNTINVKAGVYVESIEVDHDNMTLNGANAGANGNSFARADETFILPHSPAFTVTSDNVIIDGFSIIGDGVGNDIGVKIDSADNVSVENNTMIGIDFGVLADNADYLKVRNNKIELALVDAIHVDNSDHIELAGNLINGAAVDGIKVSGGHGAAIHDNEILDSGDDGIDVHDNNRANISDNAIDTTGLDKRDGNGIHLVNSGRSRIVNNNILKAGDDGIDAEGNDNIRILRNRVKASGDDGIQVFDSNGVLIRKNHVTFSDDDGVYVSDSDNVRIVKNRISNADDAVRGNDLGGAVISRNTISNVDGDGITVDTFGTLQISYNDISDIGGSGLYIHEGDFVSAYDNWITRTVYDGIHVAGIYGGPSYQRRAFASESYGSDVDIYGNDVSFSGRDGIYVNDATSTYIANNIIDHGTDDGIDVLNTELSYIVGNAVAMVGDNGIGVDGGAYAGIFDNKVLLTGDQGIDIDNINWDFDGSLVALDNRDYGYGWAVNIAGNEVAFTGTSGIEVQNSGATRVSYNDVIFAGMGHELSHLINDINEMVLDGIDDDAPRGIEVSRQLIIEDYEPNFSWIWGDGDGIHVDNSYDNGYGPGPGGWSVKIDNNRVARTGGDGIEVHDADRTLIYNNVVRYAGIDETRWYGYRNMGGVLGQGSFASEDRRDLWGDRKMNNIIRRYIPRPDYIVWSYNDGIRAENINSEFYNDYSYRLLSAPAFADQIRDDGEGYYGYEYGLVIIDNKVRKTGDDGIEVDGAGRTLIDNNYVDNAARNGIFLAGSRGRIRGPVLLRDSERSFGFYRDDLRPVSIRSRVDITNNEVSNSGRDGVLAMDISDLTISGNNVSDSEEHGIHVGGRFNRYVEFQDNILIDNGVDEGFAQARFESGNIDMSDLARPNIFINTTGIAATALQFDDIYHPFGGEGEVESVVFDRRYYGGSGLSIVNETLGSTRFNGYAPAGSYYVRFEDGSILDPVTIAPIVISGMNSSFDGIVPNSFLGGILPSPVLNFIEDRLYDADDNIVNGRGQIFVGGTISPVLDDIQDFFRYFRFRTGSSSGAILTINGLPFIGGGADGLNNIAPAAGDNSEEASELAGISPAAGGDDNNAHEVTCVSDALNSLGSGSVTYKFGGTFEDSIASESKCTSTKI